LAPENSGQEPEDEGDRVQPHVSGERRLHLSAPPNQGAAGQRQAGRDRAGAERDEAEGGRGPQARNRGLHRQNHEEQEAVQPQSAGHRGRGAAEQQVPAFAGYHQEENRGTDRARVHQAI
jgi:hypothetical protein